MDQTKKNEDGIHRWSVSLQGQRLESGDLLLDSKQTDALIEFLREAEKELMDAEILKQNAKKVLTRLS